MHQNRLLSRLSKAELRRINPFLRTLNLDLGHLLYKAHTPIDYAYFPTAGVCSAIVKTTEGRGVEVATVGDEGVVGLPALVR